MGWCSWNAFNRNFTEDIFYRAADEMVTNGMQAAGYEYINVDGGWWEGIGTGKVVRNSSGYPTWSAAKYPRGLPTLIEYIHKKGFKYGHYTNAGPTACSGDEGTSQGYEAQDVHLFTSWGIDMLKVDACYTPVPPASKNKDIIQLWNRLLNESGRKVLFSNCRNGCRTDNGTTSKHGFSPWAPWCAELTNMWRNSGDIKATWASMLYNLDSLKGRGAIGGPGRWNDPDFLEVGVGEFAYDGSKRSLEMNRAHFALWAVTSSPLIVAPDLASCPRDILEIFLNEVAISINQQYAGNAGDRLIFDGEVLGANDESQIWYKPLPNKTAAVVLFNPASDGAAVKLNVPYRSLPALAAGMPGWRCRVLDVWGGNNSMVDDGLEVFLEPRSAYFVMISLCEGPSLVI